MQPHICPNRHPLNGSERFCPQCGTPVPGSAEPGEAALLPEAPQFKTLENLNPSVFQFGGNHQSLAILLSPYRGQQLTTKQIQKIVLESDPHFPLGSILVNDHAGGNLGKCGCAGTPDRILDQIVRGLYRVRDLRVDGKNDLDLDRGFSLTLKRRVLSPPLFTDWLQTEALREIQRRVPDVQVENLTGSRSGRYVAIGITIDGAENAWAIGADRNADFEVGSPASKPPYLGLRAASLRSGSGPEAWRLNATIKEILPDSEWRLPDRLWPVWKNLPTHDASNSLLKASDYEEVVVASFVDTFQRLRTLEGPVTATMDPLREENTNLTAGIVKASGLENKPFGIDDLKMGIRVRWSQKNSSSEWPSDLHNSMYWEFDMLKEPMPLSEEWLRRFIMPRVGTWKAYRPATKEEIAAWALPHLEEITEAYRSSALPYLETPFAELEWSRIRALPDAVAQAKRDANGRVQQSPVFRSKVAHWMLPRLYPVADKEVLGITESYESYWRSTQEAWTAITIDERSAMIAIVREEIESKSRFPVWEHFPFEVKVIELCRMGRRASHQIY